MRDNQPTKNPPHSPPTAANPSSRKRLLADPKPKPPSAAASASSPYSSLSSASYSGRSDKKTRQLPNLSDCHSCKLRINHTNPNDRLQTLDSVWRIVLLCKKCIKRVESAQICSYCFGVTSQLACFSCRDCNRSIHKDCVAKFGGFAPFSYCGSNLGFSVCIDCWMPKLLKNSVRPCRRNNKDKMGASQLGDSRVSADGDGLENEVKDVKCVVEKKAAVAAKAKENALRKAVVANSARELGSGAFDVVAKKDGSCGKSDEVAVDDAELAFQLHRAMNSSPRRSKKSCLMNANSIPKIRNSSSNLSGTSPKVRRHYEACSNSTSNEKNEGTVCESSASLKASDSGSCSDFGNLNVGAVADTRISTNGNECQGNGEVGSDIVVGECLINAKSEHCQQQDTSSQELPFNENTKDGLLECEEKRNMLHDDGTCIGKPERFFLKYSKRRISSKADLNRESKLLYDCSHLENPDSTLGSPLSCFEESKAFANAPFQSCAVQMQACTSLNGPS